MAASFPYRCEMDVSFPTAAAADRNLSVLQVDEEIGNRVQKTLSIAPEEPRVMRVSFRATEAKMLRVAVSTFCDYLTVALKCEQEFGDFDMS